MNRTRRSTKNCVYNEDVLNSYKLINHSFILSLRFIVFYHLSRVIMKIFLGIKQSIANCNNSFRNYSSGTSSSSNNRGSNNMASNKSGNNSDINNIVNNIGNSKRTDVIMQLVSNVLPSSHNTYNVEFNLCMSNRADE